MRMQSYVHPRDIFKCTLSPRAHQDATFFFAVRAESLLTQYISPITIGTRSLYYHLRRCYHFHLKGRFRSPVSFNDGKDPTDMMGARVAKVKYTQILGAFLLPKASRVIIYLLQGWT
jgi:hypothetical protein